VVEREVISAKPTSGFMDGGDVVVLVEAAVRNVSYATSRNSPEGFLITMEVVDDINAFLEVVEILTTIRSIPCRFDFIRDDINFISSVAGKVRRCEAEVVGGAVSVGSLTKFL
jgi:hypothetical protein